MDIEEHIWSDCTEIRKNDFIEYGDCYTITSMLMSYFLDFCNNIEKEDIRIHYGFIGAELSISEHIVITPHMWLSYKNKKIDLTADMQKTEENANISSSAYILDNPVKIIETISYVKPLNALNESIYKDKEKSKNIFRNTEWNKKCYDEAVKNVTSCLSHSLLTGFVENGNVDSKDMWEKRFKMLKGRLFKNRFNLLKDLIHDCTNENINLTIDIQSKHMTIKMIGDKGFKLIFSSNYTQYINVTELEFKSENRGQGYGVKIIEWLINYVKEYKLCIITVCSIVNPYMLRITETLKFDLYKNDCVMRKLLKCEEINAFAGFTSKITKRLEKVRDKKQ